MAEFFLLERELLQAAERSLQLPAEERIALADKLADAAMMHLRRSQESLTAWRKRLATAEVRDRLAGPPSSECSPGDKQRC
jgi:hypothetical protein